MTADRSGELSVDAVNALIEQAQRLGLIWRLVPGTVVGDPLDLNNIAVTIDSDADGRQTRAQSLIGPVLDDARVMTLIIPPANTYVIGAYGEVPSRFIDEVTRTSTVPAFTAETLLDQITFNAASNVRYRLTWVGTMQSTVAGDGMGLRMRWKTGATLDSTGTLVTEREINADVINKGMVYTLVQTITGITAGQTSIGVLGVRHSGTGNLSSFADATRNISTLLEVC